MRIQDITKLYNYNIMIPEIDKVLKFPPLECRNADARCKQCISQHRCRVKGQSYTNV